MDSAKRIVSLASRSIRKNLVHRTEYHFKKMFISNEYSNIDLHDRTNSEVHMYRLYLVLLTRNLGQFP